MGIGNPIHLIFIAAVALIVLGPKRLPELARSLGNGMREFRESMSEAASDGDHTTPSPVPQQAQLLAASEAAVATPADAVVVDPAAPERAATAVPSDIAVPMAAAEAVEPPSPPWHPDASHG